MIIREARCACGQLEARCEGEPAFVSLCNCTQCQRRTGSAFGVAAFYTHETVVLTGEATEFTRGADSGYDVSFRFCPKCGTTVYWYPARLPAMVAVGLGGFADPDFPTPKQSVYEEHKLPWVTFGFVGAATKET